MGTRGYNPKQKLRIKSIKLGTPTTNIMWKNLGGSS